MPSTMSQIELLTCSSLADSVLPRSLYKFNPYRRKFTHLKAEFYLVFSPSLVRTKVTRGCVVCLEPTKGKYSFRLVEYKSATVYVEAGMS